MRAENGDVLRLDDLFPAAGQEVIPAPDPNRPPVLRTPDGTYFIRDDTRLVLPDVHVERTTTTPGHRVITVPAAASTKPVIRLRRTSEEDDVVSPVVTRPNKPRFNAGFSPKRIAMKLGAAATVSLVASFGTYYGVTKLASDIQIPFVGKVIDDQRSPMRAIEDYAKALNPWG